MDSLVRIPQGAEKLGIDSVCSVVPAKAGTHIFQCVLDSRFRESDRFGGFFTTLNFRSTRPVVL